MSDPLQKLKEDGLEFLKEGAGSAAADQLQDELGDDATEVIIGLADIAGGAFGLPGVGSMVAPYLEMFGGLLSGGPGGGRDAAIVQAIEKLQERTAQLEGNVSRLRTSLSELVMIVATNENNQRIDLIYGLGGESGYMSLLQQFKSRLELDYATMDSSERLRFQNELIDFSAGWIPPPMGTDVWAWRTIKIWRGALGPEWKFGEPAPSLALALEPYLQTLALLVSVRNSVGGALDAKRQHTIRRHIAFLTGDSQELESLRRVNEGHPELKAVGWSLTETLFPVHCSWDLAHPSAPYGSNDDIVVTCEMNESVAKRSIAVTIPFKEQIDSYVEHHFLVDEESAKTALLLQSCQYDIDEAKKVLKWQVLNDAEQPVSASIIAAARALGARFPSQGQGGGLIGRFNTELTPIASRFIYAVDNVGKMHTFIHSIANVDLWEERNRDDQAAPREDLRIIGAVEAPLGGHLFHRHGERQDGDMARSPPGREREILAPGRDLAGYGDVISPGAAIDRQARENVDDHLPLARYELRSAYYEVDPIQGQWSGFVDIIPGQLTSKGQIVFGEKADGKLLWRRLDLPAEMQMSAPVAGTNWTSLKNVFSTGEGVLYGVNSDGQLVWYRDKNIVSGLTDQPNWEQRPVGTGWGEFTRLFSPGKGIVYVVKPDGTLWWYRHFGYLAGTPWDEAGAWSASRQIGTGWGNFTKVFAAPPGFIYAINGAGELLFYNHLGWETGDESWESPVKLAEGWTKYRITFPAMGGTDDDGGAPIIVH